jgi:hypothetical protein
MAKSELKRGLSCATFGIVVSGLAGCSPPPQPVALHKAALTLRVLMDQGGQLDEITKAFSALKIEFEAEKGQLPKDVEQKCDRASSVAESTGRILRTLTTGSAQELSQLKSDLKNVGSIKNDKDLDDLATAIDYAIPRPNDTDKMAAEREQLREMNNRQLGATARLAVLEATKTCEAATEHVGGPIDELLQKL